ncbi:transcriptional regulatory protein ZraR [bacterium BMS3Abin05]|nr:transcriptional regulatory protein ZraR [bacterium BMS3Abin05]GBE28725.1 transcriptional regulatory protein ZraR [bacterium BMS3Bbin03]HDL78127.1 sigma-54-dependent Fis family transcriptional regulator [Bacteroidota bacterium]
MAKEYQVLIVDDDINIRKMIEIHLKKDKIYELLSTSNGEACLKIMQENIPDFVLLDIQMPGIDGIETLRRIKKDNPKIPVVMMTAHGTIETAVKSMQLGAFDFITKPFSGDRLRLTVKNAIENSSLKAEVSRLRQELQERYRFENIVGESGSMQEVFKAVKKVTDSNVTVLLQGESGTGKELIARAIHFESEKRKNRPFVPVNCSALPESLLESELFGHEKGSFTGASSRRIGKFEQADGGTVFLDEIGEMSPSTQVKILRVLQEREFERVGGNELIHVDVRIISATNKDLEEAIKKGQFREDLYYRLSVFPIVIPPLRERKEDIPLLAQFFVDKYSEREGKEVLELFPDTLELLTAYHWPGNVRELENAIERAVILASTDQILPKDLPANVRAVGEKKIAEPGSGPLNSWIERLEEEALRKALLESEGNVSLTARKLGIGRATIYRKARKYGLPIVR